jgi:hypothetical protein
MPTIADQHQRHRHRHFGGRRFHPAGPGLRTTQHTVLVTAAPPASAWPWPNGSTGTATWSWWGAPSRPWLVRHPALGGRRWPGRHTIAAPAAYPRERAGQQRQCASRLHSTRPRPPNGPRTEVNSWRRFCWRRFTCRCRAALGGAIVTTLAALWPGGGGHVLRIRGAAQFQQVVAGNCRVPTCACRGAATGLRHR